MEIIGLHNPFGLIQKAGAKKRRRNTKRNKSKSKKNIKNKYSKTFRNKK